MTTRCKPSFDSSHDHPHLHETRKFHRAQEQRRLFIALFITLLMLLIEVVGGILTNSLALLSDAAHMLSHSFTLVVSILAIRIAKRDPTDEKTYGFYRAEILAALFNGLSLLVISFFILYHAYFRILNPEPIAGLQMFLIALAGLFVNLLTTVVLRDVSHDDLNVKSVFFHLLGDTLSSVAIVIAAIVINFTGWMVLDPAISILVALLILYWAYKVIRSSCHILLEASPKHLSIEKISAEMKQLCPQIKEIHDIHVWEITSKFYAMTAHLTVSDMTVSETSAITNKLNKHLDHTHHITHTNFQFES